MQVKIDEVEDTDVNNISINNIINGISSANFDVDNTHTIGDTTIRDLWEGRRDDSAEVRIYGDSSTLLFVGNVTDVTGEKHLTIKCECDITRLTWYNIASGNSNFKLWEGKVTSVAGNIITLEDVEGNAATMVANEYDDKYAIVSDSTLETADVDLQNGVNDWVGYDSFNDGDSETGDYTDVNNAESGSGDEWEVVFNNSIHGTTNRNLQIGLDLGQYNIPKTATIQRINVKGAFKIKCTLWDTDELGKLKFFFLFFAGLAGDTYQQRFKSFKMILAEDTYNFAFDEDFTPYASILDTDATEYINGAIGIRVPYMRKGSATDGFDVTFQALKATIYYDTLTFDTINVKIIDNTVTTIISDTNFQTLGVATGDSVYIGETMDKAFENIGTATTELPDLPVIEANNNVDIDKGITSEYLAISGYKLFTTLCDLNVYEFFRDYGTKNGLLALKESTILTTASLDGGIITGFKPITDLITHNNIYGVIEVWWSGKSSGPNPAQYNTENGNPKVKTVVRKDILTHASAMETAIDTADKYTDPHRSITLEWSTWKDIRAGYIYTFTINGVEYADQICRRVAYSFVDGIYAITGYFGGGHTPDKEAIGMKIGELEKSMTDSTVLEMTSGFLPANSWSEITNKPSTFTATAHKTSHTSGGSDEVDVKEAQISDLDHTTPINSSITTHAAITTAHHTKYTDAEAVDAIEAGSSIDPITDLVDKSAVETIAGAWTFNDEIIAKDPITAVAGSVLTDDAVGEPFGLPILDAGGKVSTNYMPAFSWGNYQDTWDATEAYPDDTPYLKGDYYIVSDAGSGSGIVYSVGDIIIWDGAEWDTFDSYNANLFAYKLNATNIQSNKIQVEDLQIRGKYVYEVPYVVNWGTEADWITNGLPNDWTLEHSTASYWDTLGITDQGIHKNVLHVLKDATCPDDSEIYKAITTTGQDVSWHVDFLVYLADTSDDSYIDIRSTTHSRFIRVTFGGPAYWCTFYKSDTSENDNSGAGDYFYTPSVYNLISINVSNGILKCYIDRVLVWTDTWDETAINKFSFAFAQSENYYVAGIGSTLIHDNYTPFSIKNTVGVGEFTLDDKRITNILDSGDAFVDSDADLMTAASIVDKIALDLVTPIANITARAKNDGSDAVACDVYRGSAQLIPHETWTKVQYNTENRDDGSNYSTANYRFTAPVDGFYTVSGSIMFAQVAWLDSEIGQLKIYRNGTAYRNLQRWEQPQSETMYLDLQGTKSIYLSATNYIELWCYQGTGISINLHASGDYNRFNVVLNK